jgi:UDP-2,3-diacylglucosamine pyrophosphatase LpxH
LRLITHAGVDSPPTRLSPNYQRAHSVSRLADRAGKLQDQSAIARVDFRHAPGHAWLQRHCASGFLRETDFDTLYIVGDLSISGRCGAIYWPQQHNDVIQKILRKARKGTRVVYIPGNHDELVTSFCGLTGNIEIKENAIHVTGSGERILIIHGHELDVVVSGSGR